LAKEVEGCLGRVGGWNFADFEAFFEGGLGKCDFFAWFFVVSLWFLRGELWCLAWWFLSAEKMSCFENTSVEIEG
jgi:hypothetical protein